MNQLTRRYVLMFGLMMVAAGLLITTGISPSYSSLLLPTAEARVGRPATPVSYAGVARRSTVRVATPGVGAGGVGGPASGVGVLPGAGAGRAGVGVTGGAGRNVGGPVNRVGVR